MDSNDSHLRDDAAEGRRARFLCLHGFRTSGEIMRQQVTGRWPAEVTSRMDLVFPDAPFPAEGRSDVEGVFDPPYYQWFQVSDKSVTEYKLLDQWQVAVAYIEELMIKHGPFDGLMGFSQMTRVSKSCSVSLTILRRHLGIHPLIL